mgnify:FL=1
MKGGQTVLVLGTFDGLHDGHRFFLREAKKLGNKLIASVTTDEVIQRIKNHTPTYHLEERLRALEASGLVHLAVAGDKVLGNWSALRQWKPDIVAIGYDQAKLEEKLDKLIAKEHLPITLVKISAHDPDRLHSRLLRKN